jgi:hypothetical protein
VGWVTGNVGGNCRTPGPVQCGPTVGGKPGTRPLSTWQKTLCQASKTPNSTPTLRSTTNSAHPLYPGDETDKKGKTGNSKSAGYQQVHFFCPSPMPKPNRQSSHQQTKIQLQAPLAPLKKGMSEKCKREQNPNQQGSPMLPDADCKKTTKTDMKQTNQDQTAGENRAYVRTPAMPLFSSPHAFSPCLSPLSLFFPNHFTHKSEHLYTAHTL